MHISLSFCCSLSFFSLPLFLQRVCQDKVFPYIVIFAKGGGRTGTEPIRAYILTFFIAVACIAIGTYSAYAVKLHVRMLYTGFRLLW